MGTGSGRDVYDDDDDVCEAGVGMYICIGWSLRRWERAAAHTATLKFTICCAVLYKVYSTGCSVVWTILHFYFCTNKPCYASQSYLTGAP